MDVHNNNTQSTDQKTELENITRKKTRAAGGILEGVKELGRRCGPN
jgi:hypothetical protein